MTRRYGNKFDVRKYGYLTDYEDGANPGSAARNRAAIQAAFDDAFIYGGQYGRPCDVVIPEGDGAVDDSVRYAGTGYCTVHLNGSLHFEPTSAKSLFRFDTFNQSTTPGTAADPTTQYSCALEGGQIKGYGPEYAGARYAKAAVELVCDSGFRMEHVIVKDWNHTTGSVKCCAVRRKGKEQARFIGNRFVTERGVWISQNPKERAGPAGPIDTDTDIFRDNDYRLTSATGEAIFLDPSLNCKNFCADGENNVSGGGWGVYWDDPAGSMDSVGFEIAHFRMEQQTGSGASIYISRRGGGKARGVVLRQIACDIATTGIDLTGTIGAKIVGGNYYRFEAQTTSPMALVLAGANTLDCYVEGFEIPKANVVGTPATLYNVGGLTQYVYQSTPAEVLSQFQLYNKQRFSV